MVDGFPWSHQTRFRVRATCVAGVLRFAGAARTVRGAVRARQQLHASVGGGGAAQVVGNNVAAVTDAVAHAAASPKTDLAIGDARWADSAVQFSVHGVVRSGERLSAAVAEGATRSEVARGENAGRTLHHVAVVRVLKDFGAGQTDGRPLRMPAKNLSSPEKSPLRLVVFMVDEKTGQVTAVAERTLSR